MNSSFFFKFFFCNFVIFFSSLEALQAASSIDDAIMDKSSDPHEIMEVYQWPMPLPEDAGVYMCKAAYTSSLRPHTLVA
jgi:hypothetical protein